MKNNLFYIRPTGIDLFGTKPAHNRIEMTPLHPPVATSATATSAPEPPQSNAAADLARRFITDTDQNIFLTGRAGTGKTTFLHQLRENLAKSYVVVAPTGVAAINAKGTTIHSQLQLPFGMLTPERMASPEANRRLAKAKQQVLQRIDLLIIDEVSMVRADVMDAIDIRLRRVRRSSKPFGGVQLLLIGDLHQLPPVVKDNEARALAERYSTPYFFSAKALQQAGLKTIELKHIYRQTDPAFVHLLGEVRSNRMTSEVLQQLNTRYLPEQPLDGYVTLTSHRRTADETNQERLASMAGREFVFRATVSGTFPESSYPTDETLRLKVGAQVMFVKNDREGLYHNGKLGTVVEIENEVVTVDCGSDGGRISVGPERWENAKYDLDKTTKEVSSEVAGSFTQIPLRLAWAITIHKSQGLTFDRVAIDAAAAFAHGQVYVALSRCRSFEGIILQTRIGSEAVRTDRQVRDYTEEQAERPATKAELHVAKADYRRRLIAEAFEFASLRQAAQLFRRHALVSLSSYPGLQEAALDALVNHVADKCEQVGMQFRPQLQSVLAEAELDSNPVVVPKRCQEAASYFVEQLDKVTDLAGQLDLETDNAEVEQRGTALLFAFRLTLAVRRVHLSMLCTGAFSPDELLAARSKTSLAQLEVAAPQRKPVVSVSHPMLYAMLADWRTAAAKEQEVRVSKVMSTRTLRAVCNARPRTSRDLRAVAGLGELSAKRYGAELLRIVARYAELAEHSSETKKVAGVNATASLSLSMHRTGSSVDDIAAERGLKPSTIYGHLAAAVEAGMIDGSGILDGDAEAEMLAYFEAHKGEAAGAYAHFNGRYDGGILRLARMMWHAHQPSDLEEEVTA